MYKVFSQLNFHFWDLVNKTADNGNQGYSSLKLELLNCGNDWHVPCFWLGNLQLYSKHYSRLTVVSVKVGWQHEWWLFEILFLGLLDLSAPSAPKGSLCRGVQFLFLTGACSSYQSSKQLLLVCQVLVTDKALLTSRCTGCRKKVSPCSPAIMVETGLSYTLCHTKVEFAVMMADRSLLEGHTWWSEFAALTGACNRHVQTFY